ncbi:hypothetical protein GCM10009787_20420 [Streptomyces bangladeshensis]|uniref:Uncharacterized protein n=1 Tax=Streptomyces bangladeshensis TaxID=295352 RepID=A0ABN3BEY1_9ACTN
MSRCASKVAWATPAAARRTLASGSPASAMPPPASRCDSGPVGRGSACGAGSGVGSGGLAVSEADCGPANRVLPAVEPGEGSAHGYELTTDGGEWPGHGLVGTGHRVAGDGVNLRETLHGVLLVGDLLPHRRRSPR